MAVLRCSERKSSPVMKLNVGHARLKCFFTIIFDHDTLIHTYSVQFHVYLTRISTLGCMLID